jgi:thiol-disulfide isomerase/thioredoxin
MNGRNAHKGLAGVSLLVAAGIMLQNAIAAPVVTSPQALVKQAKLELQANKLDTAIDELTKAEKQLGTAPGSCECHFLLGKAQCLKAKKVNDKEKLREAKRQLRTAIRVGRGNAISKMANEFMMANLPADMLTPRVGDGTEMIAAKLGLRGADRGSGGAAKPQIFEFYADWCEPCKLLEPVMAKIKTQYGDQVEVTRINVDDKNNADMLDQYDVSPIPTVIYLNPDGQVVGYSIGFSGEKSVQKEMQKLIPPVANNKT